MRPQTFLLVTSLVLGSLMANAQGGIRLGWQNSNVFYTDNNTLGPNRNFFYVGGYNHYDIGKEVLQFHYGAEYLKNGFNSCDLKEYTRHYSLNIYTLTTLNAL